MTRRQEEHSSPGPFGQQFVGALVIGVEANRVLQGSNCLCLTQQVQVGEGTVITLLVRQPGKLGIYLTQQIVSVRVRLLGQG